MKGRKDRADVLWDMAMRAENWCMAASTELEAMKKEFADLKSVDESRCAHNVHLQSVVEKLTKENGELKRRLKMQNFRTAVRVVFVIFVSVLICLNSVVSVVLFAWKV